MNNTLLDNSTGFRMVTYLRDLLKSPMHGIENSDRLLGSSRDKAIV